MWRGRFVSSSSRTITSPVRCSLSTAASLSAASINQFRFPCPAGPRPPLYLSFPEWHNRPAMRHHSGLLTDLYELTMAAGYVQTRFEATATFELFVRSLPLRRSFLV